MRTRKTAKVVHQDSEQFTLRQRLKAKPRHHWLLTRLSSVYYEQRRYALAMKYAEKAFAEVPSCPLRVPKILTTFFPEILATPR
jgi:predicted Zn-dependent protease